MLKRSLLPLLFFAHCAALTAQDAQPVDAQALLKSLKEMQEKHAASTQAYLVKAFNDFNAAAGSDSKAIDFYEQAIRATLFEGQNLQQTQFQEWKKKEAEKLDSGEMQAAARCHLTYLALTLQRANGTPVSEMLPALINYANTVLNLRDKFAKPPAIDMREKPKKAAAPQSRDGFSSQELMKKSVADGIFARWYGISGMFTGLKDWENSPGNINGIYMKTILPQMRENKDSRILQYWDARIQHESDAVTQSKLAFNIEQFNLVEKPSLLWSRAQEVLLLGQRNHAITEMFALIKKYPNHPDNADWIKALEALLTPAPTPAAPAAEPSPAG